MKHLLTMQELSEQDIYEILDLAETYKYELKKNIRHTKRLDNKILGMLFMKSSTRTRISFEAGIYQLGGHPMFCSSADLQIGRGEPIKDTARVLGRYVDGIMIRTFKHTDVEEFAEYSGISVINGLTDYAHPCQILADLLTIREYKKSFAGLNFTYIGDGNNMANSFIAGMLKVGMNVRIATPKGYEPDEKILDFAKGYGDSFLLTDDIKAASIDADVITTDVWASMGMESEIVQRKLDFKGYQINEKLMEITNKDCMILHCLPAHKGEEITEDVFEGHANEIFDEAENRLHAQKAVLYLTMGH